MAMSIEIAKDLRAQAAKLTQAADILDPPKRAKPARKSTNGRRKRQPSPDGAAPVTKNGRSRAKLDMGTAGHTTAGDRDAQAPAESLVHTTEEPA